LCRGTPKCFETRTEQARQPLPASVVKAKDENISLKNGKKLAKP